MAGSDLPQIPRRSDRYPLPSTLAVVTVVLELPTEFGTTSLTGKRWDVSITGCCVAFPGLHRLELPGPGHLIITHPFLAEIHALGGWPALARHGFYSGGLQFRSSHGGHPAQRQPEGADRGALPPGRDRAGPG